MEVREKDVAVDIKELQKKYNVAHKNLRRAEILSKEVQDSYGQLVATLAVLAMDDHPPRLNSELESLKQILPTHPSAEKIGEITNNLKKFVIISESKGKSAEPAPQGRPEGLEENLKDILVQIIRHIASLEMDSIEKKAQALIKTIQTEFNQSNWHLYVEETQELVFRLKKAVLESRQQLADLTQEIFRSLEDTENDFLETLDTETQHLTSTRESFDRQVAGDIKAIELSFDIEGATITQIRTKVFEKITSIRQKLLKKREEDAARLKQMAAEKAGVERRLADIHQRYQDFSQKSQEMLAEMEKFRQASQSDGLTNIYNRRAYDLQIAKALEELKNGHLARFALIIFDVDHFKEFNTNYGHRAGDLVLKHVARFAGQNLRQGDFLARYGGDEFIIILPEADLSIGAKISEKISTVVKSVEFKIYKDQDLTVSIGLSMGVSQGRTNDDAGSIFSRADQALYRAKDLGRNRVCTEADIKK
ncbi:MAG: diguanylate cyclase [Deltaproteobacteria bacterium]|nr:diguanylate cyclase [Deltaproteobacteria bacterium]